MPTETRRSTPVRALTAIAVQATAGAALLTADDALGFAGLRFLGAAAPTVALATAFLAVIGLVLAVRMRDLDRAVLASCVVAVALTMSSALTVEAWLPLVVVLQALAPLGVGFVAVRSCRDAPRVVVVGAAVTALLALTWAVLTVVPAGLVLFVALRASALAMMTVLTAVPYLGVVAALARRGWASAAVR